MEIYKNPTEGQVKERLVKQMIEDEVDIYFGPYNDSPRQYVVQDGTADICCKGTLEECIVYANMVQRYQGHRPMIFSEERHNENLEKYGY